MHKPTISAHRLSFYTMYRISIILWVTLLLCSCSKQSPIGETVTDKRYSFTRTLVNGYNVPLHIGIYRTPEEYNYDLNPILRITIAPRDSFVWHADEPKFEFYVDWYTENYERTNWAVRPAIMTHGLDPKLEFLDFADMKELFAYETVVFRDNGDPHSSYALTLPRKIFLNNTASETRWTAVDLVGNTGSETWATLPDSIRQKKLTFRKDMRYIYTRADYYGTMVTDSGYYDIANEDNSDINTRLYYMPLGESGEIMHNNPETGTISTDTIYLRLTTNTYIAMKKED